MSSVAVLGLGAAEMTLHRRVDWMQGMPRWSASNACHCGGDSVRCPVQSIPARVCAGSLAGKVDRGAAATRVRLSTSSVCGE